MIRPILSERAESRNVLRSNMHGLVHYYTPLSNIVFMIRYKITGPDVYDAISIQLS